MVGARARRVGGGSVVPAPAAGAVPGESGSAKAVHLARRGRPRLCVAGQPAATGDRLALMRDAYTLTRIRSAPVERMADGRA